jgi:hypothetical protein
MTLCPVALTAGCSKCPIFAICLVKGLVGDQKRSTPKPSEDKESGKR